MAAESTKGIMGGDLLPHIESFQYNLLSLPVENPTGAATVVLDQVAGIPVVIDANKTKASLVEVGLTSFDEAQCNGLLVHGPKQDSLAATNITAEKYSVLWNGPGAVNEDAIATVDSAGNAITLANIKSALDTNLDTLLKYQSGPPNESTQSS